MSIVAYLAVVLEIVELMWNLTVAMLVVGVARSPLYWIMFLPDVYLTLFLSVLFGQSVHMMQV